MARNDRACKVGYGCGGTCISKKKVCLKKLGTNRAQEIAGRFVDTIKNVGNKTAPNIKDDPRDEPDLISDV